ncbi:Flp family type IVb pilin [Endozoicomonas acroporae]|uniref:Flp family type IVb pilin n=1 Tax=Endozoicomonas acroporae TaxID=1701104 RepID=UPI003D7BA6FF
MIRQLIRDFLKEEDGLAAVEYAVLAGAVIAGVSALTAAIFGDKNSSFTAIGTAILNDIKAATGTS